MMATQTESTYWVYIARCADDTLYTGMTTDVERRIAEHNAGTGAKYTKARRPIRCVFMEKCAGKSAALKREAAIKKLSRAQKEALIKAAFKAPEASSRATRSTMQGNKGKNTKPELVVRQRLRAAGLTGYRLHWKVAGHPDIAWPGKKVALFVSGCFWHRCPKCNLPLPKKHTEYWLVKFDANVERDRRTRKALEDDGWTVFNIWECEIKKDAIEETFARLLPELSKALGKPLIK